ncbi:hypothetical protein PGT21_024324 [Puccinia graminis f. sp. tritici]|uniref:Uncharacterized protein n=1 Tax=Puccinia graminis f. sp. tritici TaxID=56615 RepID=A0A5B0NM16_PUCGR|nr:hypothetical protein PGT21_024324 [Puccinia graminis f. sp. tritici]
MLIVCLTLLVTSAAPLASTFGTLNGLTQPYSELARTLALFITGTIFSISIKQQYRHGNLIYPAKSDMAKSSAQGPLTS